MYTVTSNYSQKIKHDFFLGSRISPLPERLVSSGQIALDKMKAPEFLQVPEDQTIDEGSPFTLLVQVQAEPPPTVTW